MPNLTNPFMLGLSILGGVSVCLCSNTIKAVHMLIAVFPLLNVPHVLTSAVEGTTLQTVLHYVWIGPFLLGVVFTGRGEGQFLI